MTTTDIVSNAVTELGGDPRAPLWESLDSIGIVELLVKLEELFPGKRLLGNRDVVREGGPIETVEGLVAHLEGK